MHFQYSNGVAAADHADKLLSALLQDRETTDKHFPRSYRLAAKTIAVFYFAKRRLRMAYEKHKPEQ